MKQGFKGRLPLDGVWGVPTFPLWVERGREELSKSLIA